MSDVVVRWISMPGEEGREERFENVSMDILAVGPVLVGWRIKTSKSISILPLARVEMVTEYLEQDPRDEPDPQGDGRVVGKILPVLR